MNVDAAKNIWQSAHNELRTATYFYVLVIFYGVLGASVQNVPLSKYLKTLKNRTLFWRKILKSLNIQASDSPRRRPT